MLLYGGRLAASAVAFNLIWRHLTRAQLLVPGVSEAFRRDVDIRYLAGLAAYTAATLLALVSPLLALVVTVILALVFVLGPSPRSALPAPTTAPLRTGTQPAGGG